MTTENAPRDLQDRVARIVTQTILLISGRCLTLQPTDRLLRPGWLESVEIPRLAMALQDQLDVTFDPTDLTDRNFETIERITALVRRRHPRT